METSLKQLKINLSWYDVQEVNEVQSWHDEEGNMVRLFECKNSKNEKITVELFTEDNSIDVYFTDTHETIFLGLMKPIDKLKEVA